MLTVSLLITSETSETAVHLPCSETVDTFRSTVDTFNSTDSCQGVYRHEPHNFLVLFLICSRGATIRPRRARPISNFQTLKSMKKHVTVFVQNTEAHQGEDVVDVVQIKFCSTWVHRQSDVRAHACATGGEGVNRQDDKDALCRVHCADRKGIHIPVTCVCSSARFQHRDHVSQCNFMV